MVDVFNYAVFNVIAAITIMILLVLRMGYFKYDYSML